MEIIYGKSAEQFAKALGSYLKHEVIERNVILLNGEEIDIEKGILIRHNKKISYIDFKDDSRRHKALKKLLKLSNLNLILKCQYRKDAIHSSKVVPFTYFVKDMKNLMSVATLSPKVKYDKLLFKGTIWDNRKLILDKLKMISNKDTKRTMTTREYYKECLKYNIGLSLPGHGNLCYREFEYFGLGIATIMPTLKNETHNPLLPDVHYAAINGDGTSSEVAERIIKKFNELKLNKTMRETIITNAHKWFNDNVAFSNSCKLACKILAL